MGAPSRPAPGRRRWTLVLAALGLLLAIAAFSLSRLLQPERLGAFVLEQAAAATGLALTVERPADVGLWPDLHVELVGLDARAPGQDQALFTAERVDLVLPWSSLLDREAVVQRLRLIAPVLQRGALARWLESRPERDGAEPFELPQLTAGLDIERGAVLGEGDQDWSLQGLALATSPLHEGQPFEATASGTLALAGGSHDFELALATTPRPSGDGLVLEPLALSLAAAGLEVPADLQGRLEWQPERIGFQVASELSHWPPAWPELPLPQPLPLHVSLAYDGPADLSGALVLEARGTGVSLHVDASAAELLAWTRSVDRTPLPPADARLAAGRVSLGGATLEEVEVELDQSPVAETPQP